MIWLAKTDFQSRTPNRGHKRRNESWSPISTGRKEGRSYSYRKSAPTKSSLHSLPSKAQYTHTHTQSHYRLLLSFATGVACRSQQFSAFSYRRRHSGNTAKIQEWRGGYLERRRRRPGMAEKETAYVTWSNIWELPFQIHYISLFRAEIDHQDFRVVFFLKSDIWFLHAQWKRRRSGNT